MLPQYRTVDGFVAPIKKLLVAKRIDPGLAIVEENFAGKEEKRKCRNRVQWWHQVWSDTAEVPRWIVN